MQAHRHRASKKIEKDTDPAIRIQAFELSYEFSKRTFRDSHNLADFERRHPVQRTICSRVRL